MTSAIGGSRSRRIGMAGLAGVAMLAGIVATVSEASAQPHGGFHGGGAVLRPHGGGGFGGRGFGGGGFGGGRHRGLGVGAAVGLGVLGAAAAGVAASQYYNGYPAYSDGTHPAYGYDYYEGRGYYGPY